MAEALTRMRAFKLRMTDEKRKHVKFDDQTWTAIDTLADLRGVKWMDLAREWIADAAGDADDTTLTNTIRRGLMDALVHEVIVGPGRAADLATMEAHPLTRDSVTLDDAGLDKFLAGSTVQGESDMGGFAIVFGHDEDGQDFLAVRNNLRAGLHFVTIAPAGKGEK